MPSSEGGESFAEGDEGNDGELGARASALGGEGCQSGTDTLEEYAHKCDIAMNGVTVPHFNCDDGSPLEGQGPTFGKEPAVRCDAPNVLNSECDKDSKFQVLHRSEDYGNDGIYVVAHCRKRGGANRYFGDIAAIQYNANTGATCFYQALPPGDGIGANATLSGDVPAPSKGDTPKFWKSPYDTARIQCVKCHDNGPFVRTPYLAQLGQVWPRWDSTRQPDKYYLPGTLDANVATWNQNPMPYKFVGLDFQSWEAYSVTDSQDTTCTSCHRMGVAQIGSERFAGVGTAAKMGPLATSQIYKANGQLSADRQLSKNDHKDTSPIWMTPGRIEYDDNNYSRAKRLRECAIAFASKTTLPDYCQINRFASGDTCGAPPEVIINGKTNSQDSGYQTQTETELGCKDAADCPPGFFFWTALHGPFYQNTPLSISPNSKDFRGTYARIFVRNGKWVAGIRLDASDYQIATPQVATPGAPGGAIGSLIFAQIRSVQVPPPCGSSRVALIEDGTHPSSNSLLNAPAGLKLNALTSFIGNVSRTGDEFLRITDTRLNDDRLSQFHVTSIRRDWFTSDAWSNGCRNWSASADFAVTNAQSRGDIQLVTAANAHKVACFITGIGGDWSKPQVSSTGVKTQTFAEIYTGANEDIRLRVGPAGVENAASAYASCVYLK